MLSSRANSEGPCILNRCWVLGVGCQLSGVRCQETAPPKLVGSRELVACLPAKAGRESTAPPERVVSFQMLVVRKQPIKREARSEKLEGNSLFLGGLN